ncbi:cytochrome b561 and DOMON domain-containing protein At5g35735-like isoform X2 [Andrographis paniculata]|uniref:cytochrome b561 and DOMON domain-containing protein At5g35735-like isoform X2 n=1 Tax=Andrographis paniculata TaxID=175694 RepID=UPI0021E8B82A|nr:cytochrome b561 and DOMON domain-containing protein At5g35735-like isoform X2 [Andrographis paniculata]
MLMNFPNFILYFTICTLISLFHSTGHCLNDQIPHPNLQEHHKNTDNNRTADPSPSPRPWTGARLSQHRHLRTVHGTLNIVGWGVLTPVGILSARYLRKVSDEWYSVHVVSHFSGFLLGALGWGLGISIKNAAGEHAMSAHGVVGTIIFAFAAIQVLAVCLQLDEEHGLNRCWVIYHYVAGYALIVVIVANIFEGIHSIQMTSGSKWQWIYGCVLGVLGLSTLALEVLKWLH